MPRRTEDLPEEYTAYKQALARAIGGRIRARRLELHVSQEHVRAQMQLASVYVSRTQFSRIETGDILPDAAELMALGQVLQRSCSWLLDSQAEPSRGDA